jgi:two-component system sensor histidine kinase UhpB
VAPRGTAARADFFVVLLVTLTVFGVAALMELNERLLRVLHPFERFQLDELPLTLLCLSCGLLWFAWRRFCEARLEIAQRLIVERELERSRQELRELAHQRIDMQEDERRALARELHDDLGQTLNAIKIEAVSIRNASAGDDDVPQEVLRATRSVIEHADQVYGVVRRIIGRLRPVALDELGLAAALEHCVDGWRERLPKTRFDLRCEGAFDNLDEPRALALYRVVQESLTNVARHAQANRVDIHLRQSADSACVELTIQDDGCGVNLAALPHGFGLLGMRERVDALGGCLDLASSAHQGFRLIASIPLPLQSGA